MIQAGILRSMYRYPIKSMLGQACDSVDVDTRGVVGDRQYAVRTQAGKFGSGKNTRRFARLDGLLAFAAGIENETHVVECPDGRKLLAGSAALDAVLSEAFAEPVAVVKEQDISHMDASPIHLISSASLTWLQRRLPAQTVDARRFRANAIIACDGEAAVEQAWIGKTLALGDVRLKVVAPTERCVMVTMPQQELESAPEVLRIIAQECGGVFGVYAQVIAGGRMRRNDTVYVE